jgi:phosphate acetyltransferase
VAASEATRQRLARITVLGNEEKVRAAARDAGADLGGVDLIDHVRATDFEKVVSLLYEARRAKGMTLDEARTALRDPLYYGNLMVRSGRADGSVAGATNTTSHTVRVALHCIGVRPGFKLCLQFSFLMQLGDPNFGHNGAMIYADCGVVIELGAAELAEIAIALPIRAGRYSTEPRVAMLSFSTQRQRQAPPG